MRAERGAWDEARKELDGHQPDRARNRRSLVGLRFRPGMANREGPRGDAKAGVAMTRGAGVTPIGGYPPAKAGGTPGGRAAMIALAAPSTSAQDQPTPLFRTRADIVRVDVLATQGAAAHRNLKSEDFELSDNGVAQQAQLASIDDLEIDVVLAVDVSTSVRGELLGTLRDAARRARWRTAARRSRGHGDVRKRRRDSHAADRRSHLAAARARAGRRRAAARRSSTRLTPAWR